MDLKKWKNEKITGYVLLIIGVLLIVYTIITILGVFNGNTEVPVKILKEDTTQIQQNGAGTNTSQSMNLGQIMIPLFPMFNVFIWVVLAFVLIAAGGRLSGLGIRMIKEPKSEIKILKMLANDKSDKQDKKE